MIELTDRERVIIQLLAEGLPYREIADRIGVSTGMLKQKIHAIYQKLHKSGKS